MNTSLLDQIDLSKLSPMMLQYVELKRQNLDTLLFFRLGDFYELFFDDALVAAKALEIALTGRDCGQVERAPMCGVPHHAMETYLAKLIQQGYKVAICEQLEDPAQTKGIVKRGITKIVTPGTIMEGDALLADRNNYLVSIYRYKKFFALAYVDISTYELKLTYFVLGDCEQQMLDEVRRIAPAEIVCDHLFYESELAQQFVRDGILLSEVTYLPSRTKPYRNYYPQGDQQEKLWAPALNTLLAYLEKTQLRLPLQLQQAQLYFKNNFLYLNQATRRNLELVESLNGGTKKGSLLGILDLTATSMGSRLLRKMLEQPLVDRDVIEQRLSAVDAFKSAFILRQELRKLLTGMQDVERLVTKIINGNATPRDLGALNLTLLRLPKIKELLQTISLPLIDAIVENLSIYDHLTQLLSTSLVDQPPLTAKEGGIIREGHHAACDELRLAATEGKSWILNLEQREREKTGIRTLKVGYNRVFGYYLEVTKGQIHAVPAEYIRKQTLANAERYITEELKQLESTVLGAQQKLLQLEYALFVEIRLEVAQEGVSLLHTAHSLAQLDCLLSLAEVADRYNYVRPEFVADARLTISAGRHPVVEQNIAKGNFVPNDLFLDGQEKSFVLLTGPNMAGKSTYMRQIALIVILAQMGSFVPAAEAKIGLVDAVYTRIGASDDLASGQSTFMVEMKELAVILRKATSKSLLILDEIGRGTSTADGLAIASAVMETLAGENSLAARTLFATHYHELITLEEKFSSILNYHVAVEKKNKDVAFLHHIRPGGSDDSFGIDVARLAGVPTSVVDLAEAKLRQIEAIQRKNQKLIRSEKPQMKGQVDFLSLQTTNKITNALVNQLAEVDIQTMSPLECLHLLNDLAAKAKQIRGE